MDKLNGSINTKPLLDKVLSLEVAYGNRKHSYAKNSRIFHDARLQPH